MPGLLFRRKPLLEPTSVEWMFDVYQWAFDSFGSDVFYHSTELVVPNEHFFPVSRDGQPEDVALALFQAV